MRVLVVSHNVFSKTENMGKTLSAYFKSFGVDELAQFYIHSEIPTVDLCENYYRITDKDIIKSVITRKSGQIFNKSDIQTDKNNSRTDTGTTAKIYQKARKRTPVIYFLRNLFWSFGCWNTKKLKKWLDNFNPDAVFLASGDYSFIYKIAFKIAKEKKISLFVSCMDDYYFNNKNSKTVSGRLYHRGFMKQVNKTMAYASAIFSICDKMTEDYAMLFGKPVFTLHTGTEIKEPLNSSKTGRISYIGNLGYGRDKQLVSIGRALLAAKSANKPEAVDVYSSECRPEILKNLTAENGINFRGQISAEQVRKVMGESMLLIHTESFDDTIRKSVSYSVSTKIADSLASGTCLLAYGPNEVASISYLINNKSAYCITSEEKLISGIEEIMENSSLREEIAKNAVTLAHKNHNAYANSEIIKNIVKKYALKK